MSIFFQYLPSIITLVSSVSAIMWQVFKMKQGFKDLRKDMSQQGKDLRSEMQALRQELKQEITNVRVELKQDILDVRTELKQEIANVRAEFRQEINNLRVESKQDIGNLANNIELRFKDTNYKIDSGNKDIRTEMKEGFIKRDHDLEKTLTTLKISRKEE